MMAQVRFLPAVAHQGKGRHRSLLSLHLATAILWCVWNGWQSQQAVWRLIVGGFAGFASLKISDQAIYKRIGEQGMDAMKELFEQMSAWLHDLLTPLQDLRLAPFANDIFLLDECPGPGQTLASGSSGPSSQRWTATCWPDCRTLRPATTPVGAIGFAQRRTGQLQSACTSHAGSCQSRRSAAF
jgi:hypothetical protein